MKQLILIRSGSTAWQEAAAESQRRDFEIDADAEPDQKPDDLDDRRLQGTLPLPLSDKGKAALRQVADILKGYKFGTIYNSGNESSGPTAEYIADLCEIKTKKITELRELNCGLWQGLRIKDIKKRYGKAYKQWRSDPASVCPPEGEPLDDCRERVTGALKTIFRKSKTDTVVITAAAIVAALIECLLTGKTMEKIWEIADHDNVVRRFELTEKMDNDLPEALQLKPGVPDAR